MTHPSIDSTQMVVYKSACGKFVKVTINMKTVLEMRMGEFNKALANPIPYSFGNSVVPLPR